MAGFYPDVPAPKMALDKDGTQWFGVTGTGLVEPVTSTKVANLTGTVTSLTSSTSGYTPGALTTDTSGAVAVVFPEPRDVAALFTAGQLAAGVGVMNVRWEYSLDTTNGLDGAWTQCVAAYDAPQFAVPAYRSGLLPVALSGVRGVRAKRTGANSFNMLMAAFHVYGTVSAGVAGDRLAIWHPTLDEPAPGTMFDWGDVPRNTTATRTFRVKNLSPSKTAGTARAAMSSLPTDASPTVVGQHALSADGSTWLSQLALGNLAPGAITPVLSLRRVTPSNAQPGPYIMRVFAEATTWT